MSYPLPHIDPMDEKLPDDIINEPEPELTIGDIVDTPFKSWTERRNDLLSLFTVGENPKIIEKYLTEFDELENSYIVFHRTLQTMFTQKI